MSRSAPQGGGWRSALVAAATAWVAMLSWRGFTEETHRFLLPLVLLAVVVAGSGVLLRSWRAPGSLVVAVQVVLAGLVAAAVISGSVLPVGGGWTALRGAFVAAHASANRFAPPVPAEAPGVHPYLIVGGLGVLLLVDVLACTLRRAPLAGLPLLAAYSVPVGMLGIGLVWWVFALTAVGFLRLLYLEQGDRVRRWGRALDHRPSHGATGTAAAPPSSVGLHAGAIGGGVTVVAVLLPLLIPTLSVHLLDLGRGPGGDSDIQVVNPTTDLRRDLQRPKDVPLVRFTTDDPSPGYLRIATLNRFSGSEWSSGDRDIPTSQVADGPLPALLGVDPGVKRTPHGYSFEATDAFDSTWLPTPAQTTQISAAGDWRYDASTRDFIAADDDLTTSGLDWSLQADDLGLTADALARAGSSTGLVSPSYLDVPAGISPYVRNLTFSVTRDAASPYEKAVALQNWFRDSGGFEYSTEVSLKTSTDDLVAFLSPKNGGRTGYCEQFASSMALMARQLGIPARVAVGFLRPDRIGDGQWEYSSHDLHAWPELFFAGAGWVRFEPTPATRASGVPSYTEQGVTPADPDIADAPDGPQPDETVRRGPASAAPETPDPVDTSDDDQPASSSWWPYVVAVGAVALLVLLALTPALVRRRRRDRRLRGGIEAAWAELHDTCVDLGRRWPQHRSPRETGAVVVAAMAGLDPGAHAALERLVVRLERSRFAAGGGPGEQDDQLALDVERVTQTLAEAAPAGARRRATWLPRSVFRRRPADQPDRGTDDAGTPTRLLETV